MFQLAKAAGQTAKDAANAAKKMPDAAFEEYKILQTKAKELYGRFLYGQEYAQFKKNGRLIPMKIKDALDMQYKNVKTAGKEMIEGWKKEFETPARKEEEENSGK